jgi:hypothetical protein
MPEKVMMVCTVILVCALGSKLDAYDEREQETSAIHHDARQHLPFVVIFRAANDGPEPPTSFFPK